MRHFLFFVSARQTLYEALAESLGANQIFLSVHLGAVKHASKLVVVLKCTIITQELHLRQFESASLPWILFLANRIADLFRSVKLLPSDGLSLGDCARLHDLIC